MEINDLAGVKEPLTKLVESISNGIGAIYEPIRIRRKAKADADAMLTLAGADIQIEELKKHADERITHTELRRQRNIEQIIAQAASELPEAVDATPTDEDWIAQFFNLSQDIGDEEMQTLWARILAGEVTHPGAYSLRTLQTVKLLSKKDAQRFSQYCSYVWLPSGKSLCRYPTNETDTYLAAKGIGAAERQHLQNLGLLYSTSHMNFSRPHTVISSLDEPFEAMYFGRRCLIRQFLNPKENALLDPEILTDIGIQLFPISGAQADEQYMETLIRALASEVKLEVSLL